MISTEYRNQGAVLPCTVMKIRVLNLVIEAVALDPSMRSRVSCNIRSGTAANPLSLDSNTAAKSEHAASAALMAP